MRIESDLRLPQAGLPTVWPGLPAHLHARIGFLTTGRAESTGQSTYAFNLGLHVGDTPDAVLQRRTHLATHHRIAPVWMKQVHGCACVTLQAQDSVPHDALTADAAFTQHAGVAAVVMTADCLPVLLTDAQGRAVAAAHCGWRGLLDGVLDSVIDQFETAGLLDGPLHAWLGPCIGPASFEVGDSVRSAYVKADPAWGNAFRPIPGGLRDEGRYKPGKWLADLPELARHALQRRHPVTVDWDGRDTYTDPNLNSFRRNPVTGRQASLIWLR